MKIKNEVFKSILKLQFPSSNTSFLKTGKAVSLNQGNRSMRNSNFLKILFFILPTLKINYP